MPNSSSAIGGSCVSCAAGWAGSSATSAARSRASQHWRRRSPCRWPRHADPLAAAAPARLEAVFLPCPGGGVHRQGQGRRALRVRRQGLHRHQQRAGLPAASSCCTPGRYPTTRTTATPCGTSLTAPRHSPAVRSSAAYVDKGYRGHDTKIPVASSSPARSAASSVSSSASCDAAPPSSPSSAT